MVLLRRRLLSLIDELLKGEPERSESLREQLVPRPVYEYAKRISEVTGLPLREVLRSQPVQSLIKRWTEHVRVQL